MILIVCVDDNMGLAFNKRRQSQDSILRQIILERTNGSKLWMNAYSRKQFKEDGSERILVSDEPQRSASAGEYCLIETEYSADLVSKAEKIILYRWNRKYPADLRFDVSLEIDWQLVKTSDFAGSSHEKITEEVYIR